jgi:hypothetical protein
MALGTQGFTPAIPYWTTLPNKIVHTFGTEVAAKRAEGFQRDIVSTRNRRERFRGRRTVIIRLRKELTAFVKRGRARSECERNLNIVAKCSSRLSAQTERSNYFRLKL